MCHWACLIEPLSRRESNRTLPFGHLAVLIGLKRPPFRFRSANWLGVKWIDNIRNPPSLVNPFLKVFYFDTPLCIWIECAMNRFISRFALLLDRGFARWFSWRSRIPPLGMVALLACYPVCGVLLLGLPVYFLPEGLLTTFLAYGLAGLFVLSLIPWGVCLSLASPMNFFEKEKPILDLFPLAWKAAKKPTPLEQFVYHWRHDMRIRVWLDRKLLTEHTTSAMQKAAARSRL